MAGNLSPAAQGRLNEIALLGDKVQRAHGLVEQFAAAKVNLDQLQLPLTRLFNQLKMQFMGIGLDALPQLAGSMEIAARRGMSPMSKARILREGVGSMKFQMELAQRAIVADDQAAAKAKEAERARDGG